MFSFKRDYRERKKKTILTSSTHHLSPLCLHTIYSLQIKRTALPTDNQNTESQLSDLHLISNRSKHYCLKIIIIFHFAMWLSQTFAQLDSSQFFCKHTAPGDRCQSKIRRGGGQPHWKYGGKFLKLTINFPICFYMHYQYFGNPFCEDTLGRIHRKKKKLFDAILKKLLQSVFLFFHEY